MILNKSKKIQNTVLFFLFIAPATMIYYASYVFNPLNAGDIFLYIFLVIADGIALINIGTLWITILLDIIQSDEHKKSFFYNKEWLGVSAPKVDVLIPVANEPLSIIENTVAKAEKMDYRHQTYLLDDGQSNEAEILARKYGIHYFRRLKHTREYAKSGNLNYGLKYCKGDYVAVFDADQSPEKNFLSELLPYFANEQVALVQTPQFYVNTDHFIAAGTSQAQEVFYKYIQPAKNSYNASFCVGTNMIYRRSALAKIGGIALHSHSEDIWTSLLLHEKGYTSIFYNKVLAKGLAPETIPSFFRQQYRWSLGGFTLFFIHNPLFQKSLTIDQRLQYFFSNIHYFTAFSVTFYLIFPIIYLLFGLHPMNVQHSGEWLIHYIPYFVMVYFLPFFLLGNIKIATISTSLASFVPYIKSFVSVVLKSNYKWIATEERRSSPVILADIWPHLLIIFLSFSAIYVGWYNVNDIPTTLYTTIWALINSYLLFIFISRGLSEK